MTRVRVTVRGRVQGVCFRAEARDVARALGVGGWVRNEPDGSVAAAFEGDVGSVERMVDWCRHGPPDARVDSVDVTMERPVGERRFVVRAQ